MEKNYNFPMWGTQGGGLVREVSQNPYRYVFVEAPPEGMGLGIGDSMPEQWDIIPANQQAREVATEEQFGPPLPVSSLFEVVAPPDWDAPMFPTSDGDLL